MTAARNSARMFTVPPFPSLVAAYWETGDTSKPGNAEHSALPGFLFARARGSLANKKASGRK